MASMPGATNFLFEPPQKKFHFLLWVIFRGSPLFLAVSGHSHFAVISAPNFGPPLTKLGGWDGWMVILGHRSSKSTFSANNIAKL